MTSLLCRGRLETYLSGGISSLGAHVWDTRSPEGLDGRYKSHFTVKMKTYLGIRTCLLHTPRPIHLYSALGSARRWPLQSNGVLLSAAAEVVDRGNKARGIDDSCDRRAMRLA